METEKPTAHEKVIVALLFAFLATALGLYILGYKIDEANTKITTLDTNLDTLHNDLVFFKSEIGELQDISNNSRNMTLPGITSMTLTRGIRNETHLIKFVEVFVCKNKISTFDCIRNTATEYATLKNEMEDNNA